MVGYFTSESASLTKSLDLFDRTSFLSNSVWAAIEIGLFASDVLSTKLIPKFSRAPSFVEAPVPPFVKLTSPVNLADDTDLILASVTFSSKIFAVVIAFAFTSGAS